MHPVNFTDALANILKQDARFHPHAYVFVRQALDHTQKAITKANQDKVRHVTGQELLAGIREYALQEYGPMAHLVLSEWGVSSCENFGDIVFNMVEANLLAKTDQDSPDDFKGGYDFDEAFRQPFRPNRKASTPETQTRSAQP